MPVFVCLYFCLYLCACVCVRAQERWTTLTLCVYVCFGMGVGERVCVCVPLASFHV